MRKTVARCLTLLPLVAGVLAGCEHAVTTAAKPRTPGMPTVHASVANGLPLGLTGNTGVGQYIICSVGADASYSWSNTAWGPTKIGGFSGPAGSGTATVANGGASAPTAWGSGKCVAVYSYPVIDQHQFMKPLVTSTWQAQAGIQLDSIVQDSLTAQDLSVATGPLETISSHPGASTLTAVTNNDYGEIVFYYFHQTPSLTLVKTADSTTITAGSQLGFSLVVSNAGPGVANVVSLSDPLPTGSGLSWSVASPASGCTISAGTLNCSLGPLAAGASATVHIVSPTTAASCAAYSNTATASADGGAQVQATAQATVFCPPSLNLTKTADAATVSAGSPIGFTITVSNGGPGAAQNVTVNDPLPLGTGISWSVSPAVTGCSIATGVLTCSFTSLAAGASIPIHVTSPTTAQSCAVYNNTATAQGFELPPVTASATTTVQCPNLTLVKTADAATVSAGSNIGFTLTVSSTGPGTATGVTLTDGMPPGTGPWSINPANAACSFSGATLSCSFGDMAAGASASVHVVSPTTAQQCAQYTNTASVASTNGGSAQASASTTVECPSLTLTKTADAALVNAGSPIGFSLVLSNTGQGAASNATISDPLPAGTGISWSVSPAVAGCSIASGTLSCSFASLAAGASVTVHVTSPTAFQSCAVYPNTASAGATNTATVTASASTTVQCPSLSITKTADAASVKAGNPIGFTIKVSSNGPGAATGVTLSDALPTGAGISWSISPAVAGCSIAGGTLSCSFGTMPAGLTATVHVTSPTMNGSCGTYNNTAGYTASNVPGGQASASTSVTGCLTVCTATMGGWGQDANGNNIGRMRDTFFSTVYPTSAGVLVGTSSRYIQLTNAAAVNAYLPATGGIGVLDKSYKNPTTTPALVFGGQVTALRLNIDFSNAQVNNWKPGLAGAVVTSGPLAGKTVAQVLAIAQSVLAGGALPAGMSLGDLNNLVSAINGMNSPDGCGFGNGTVRAP